MVYHVEVEEIRYEDKNKMMIDKVKVSFELHNVSTFTGYVQWL